MQNNLSTEIREALPDPAVTLRYAEKSYYVTFVLGGVTHIVRVCAAWDGQKWETHDAYMITGCRLKKSDKRRMKREAVAAVRAEMGANL